MSRARFPKSFTQQPPIPEDAIEAAVAVMRSGRLHRYNTVPGEPCETMELEREFAAWQGQRYCLAVASGGQAMQIALRASGVTPGDPVLTNGFTLAPVPGAIAAVGGKPVLVEITEDLVIDLDDLAVKARATGARHLLLSHMRGHLCDMDRLMRIAADLNVIDPRGLRAHDGRAVERRIVGLVRPGGLFQHPDLQAHEFRRGRSSDLGRPGIHGARDHPVGLLHAL